MFKSNISLVAASITILLCRSLDAAIIHVDSSALGSNDGSSWTNALVNLQAAFSAATEGDEIWVAAGTYKPTAGTDRTATFTLKTGVAIYGGFLGTETSLVDRDFEANPTILSGEIGVPDVNTDNSNHVLTGSGTDDTAVLDGFTIRDGYTAVGGALYINAGSPTLSNCIFSGNSANYAGGAIYNNSSSPALTNCTLTGNSATYYGGAMFNTNASAPTLTHCTLSGNSAGNHGGAVFNSASSPTLTHCIFSVNSATSGGAVYNLNEPSAALNNCTLSGNSAGSGGAVYNDASSPVLTNCSLSGNSTTMPGGAIYNTNASSPALTNCRLSGNSATIYGGAIFNSSHSSPELINCSLSGNSATLHGGAVFSQISSFPTLTNCIIWNNSASGATDTTSASVFSIYDCMPAFSHCLIANSGGSDNWDSSLGNDSGGNIDADPLFRTSISSGTAPTVTGDLHLQFGSPAVGSGNNASNPTSTDLDGNSRFVDTIDLGAYESVFPDPTAYLDWAASEGLIFGSEYLATADSDNDSRTNLEEFAFGTDPTNPNDACTQMVKIVEITNPTPRNYYSITIPVRSGATFSSGPSPSATIDGITYTIQGCTDMSNCKVPIQPITPALTGTLTAPAGWELASFRFVEDTVTQSKGFIWVEITAGK